MQCAPELLVRRSDMPEGASARSAHIAAAWGSRGRPPTRPAASEAWASSGATPPPTGREFGVMFAADITKAPSDLDSNWAVDKRHTAIAIGSNDKGPSTKVPGLGMNWAGVLSSQDCRRSRATWSARILRHVPRSNGFTGAESGRGEGEALASTQLLRGPHRAGIPPLVKFE